MRRTALVLRHTSIALLGALVLAACTSTHSPQPSVTTEPVVSPAPSPTQTIASSTPATAEASAAATRHFSWYGIEFDYPSDWAVNDTGRQASGQLGLVVLGTIPWGSCDAADVDCHFKLRLEPGQMQVVLDMSYLAGEDICAMGQDAGSAGSPMRVDGRPAVRTEYALDETNYYRGDEQQTWVIAKPGTTRGAYSIDATYRGPRLETMHAQLDQLIASVRLAPPAPGVVTEPDDCGDPFPPATD